MKKLLCLFSISVLSVSSTNTVINCSNSPNNTANGLVNRIEKYKKGELFSIANSPDLSVKSNKSAIITEITTIFQLNLDQTTMLINGTITGKSFEANAITLDQLTIIPKDNIGFATNSATIGMTMDKEDETANDLVEKIMTRLIIQTFSIATFADLTVKANKTAIINQIVNVLYLNNDEKTMLTNGTITGNPFVADGLTLNPLIITPMDASGLATKQASLNFIMEKESNTANELVDEIMRFKTGKTFMISNSSDLSVKSNELAIVNKLTDVLKLSGNEKSMVTDGTITGINFVADKFTKDLITIIPKDAYGLATKKATINFIMDKNYSNINSGTGSSYKMSLTIQLNVIAWSNLLGNKNHFTENDKDGFGGYLIQFANNNKFSHSDLPNIPDFYGFKKNNIIENYFGHFGAWNDSKSKTAQRTFSNHYAGPKLTDWYNKHLAILNIKTAIQISINATYSHNDGYHIIRPTWKIL